MARARSGPATSSRRTPIRVSPKDINTVAQPNFPRRSRRCRRGRGLPDHQDDLRETCLSCRAFTVPPRRWRIDKAIERTCRPRCIRDAARYYQEQGIEIPAEPDRRLASIQSRPNRARRVSGPPPFVRAEGQTLPMADDRNLNRDIGARPARPAASSGSASAFALFHIWANTFATLPELTLSAIHFAGFGLLCALMLSGLARSADLMLDASAIGGAGACLRHLCRSSPSTGSTSDRASPSSGPTGSCRSLADLSHPRAFATGRGHLHPDHDPGLPVLHDLARAA